jgi:5-methylcytosine-specific restriction endonuclease McrA
MKQKQAVRAAFRDSVFGRDNQKCKVCYQPAVDAHHITDRTEMPNGGYVKENGISLCDKCHMKAERFHITAGLEWEPNMHPDDLYRKIGSSHEKAVKASEKL